MKMLDLTAEESLDMATVTMEEIKLFKTTLVARRFPGLRGLMDEDVRNLILADRKKSGIKLLSPQKTYPKRDFAAAPPARDVPGSGSIPFVPINQAQAKENVRRPDIESYIGVGSPFDSDHQDCMRDTVSDFSKRGLPGPFLFTSPIQAREAIQVDYFLNSNDDALIGHRASQHKEQYREMYLTRRGKSMNL